MSNISLGQRGVANILLSRFNLYIPKFREMAKISDESYLAWSQNRVALFRLYTLPSVLNQRKEPYRWLIYFDVEIDEYVAGLVDELKQYPFICPIFLDLRGKSVTKDLVGRIREDIFRIYPESAHYVATTRLDTDDALNLSFCHNLNDIFHKLIESEYGQGKTAITFPFGAQYYNGVFNAYLYDKNPFISLIERTNHESDMQAFSSVFAFAHYDVELNAKLFRAFVPLPQWLQVIHGANAANEFKVELPRIVDSRINEWFSMQGP